MSLSSNFPTSKPSLNLDFANVGALDPRVTFTRSSSATYTNSLGLIATAATNVARFDYDPVTLAARGLLVEEQRTNLLLYSQEFDNAYWAKALSSITANATTSPDGTVNADQSTIDNTTGFHDAAIVQVSVTSGTVYTVSLFAKKSVGIESFYFYTDAPSAASIAKFNLNNGAYIGNASGNGYAAFSSYSSQSFGNGWYRFTATFTASATASNRYVVFGMSTNTNDNVTPLAGNGTDNFYLWGAQLEAGSFATSYIPTVASTVTRSADVASVNTVSPWYNSSESTLFAEFDISGPSGAFGGYVAQLAVTALSNNGILIYNNSVGLGTSAYIDASGVSLGVNTANVPAKIALAYNGSSNGAVRNGGSVSSVGTTVSGAATRLSLGSEYGGNYVMNGHLRQIAYYPRRLTNAEIQALTS